MYNEKKWKNAEELRIGDVILIAEEIDIWGIETLKDPYLIGLLIGDGYYGTHNRKARLGRKARTEIHSVRISNCDPEINDYVYSNYNAVCEKLHITKDKKIYKETRIRDIIPMLKEIGIAGQSKDKKRLPANYMRLTKECSAMLLEGLFDTDGTVTKSSGKTISSISITQSHKEILTQIKVLLEKFGITSIIRFIKPQISPDRIDVRGYYRLIITRKNSVRQFKKHIPILIKYKKDNLNEIILTYKDDCRRNDVFKNIIEEKVISIEYIGEREIYNLTAGNTHTYLANNIITHNTGGTDINDLIGLEQLYTRGAGYKVHMIPNIFEPELGHSETGIFIGEQRNHEIAMDKDGNSDKEKAIQYILKDREDYLNKTKNKEMLLRYIAEAPIKPSEALMQIGGNIFPVDLLKQQKAYLLSHRDTMIDSAWVGLLVPDQETGKIEWKIDNTLIPIDHYPHTDVSNLNGCVVIYEPPVRDKDGNIPFGLYISGNDNYDHDQSTTESLGSTFIMNRMTERIVAEYTGRPYVASYFYNTNRYLLMYYNAIQNFENNLKGLHADFIKNRCEYLLADTPDNVKDKIDDKRVLNRRKGTPGTTPIKKMGREYILEWLMREAEPGTGILNLHKIRSIALLDELIYHNKDGNFDRVDALIYLLIYHEDLWQRIPSYDARPKKEVHQFFANDPLFKLNTQQPKKYIIEKNVMMWPKEKLF